MDLLATYKHIYFILYKIWGALQPPPPRWVVLIAKIAPLVMLIVNVCAENVKRCLSSLFSSMIKPQLETYNHIIPIIMRQLWGCSCP